MSWSNRRKLSHTSGLYQWSAVMKKAAVLVNWSRRRRCTISWARMHSSRRPAGRPAEGSRMRGRKNPSRMGEASRSEQNTCTGRRSPSRRAAASASGREQSTA